MELLNLHLLHTLSGIAIVIALLGKIFIHFYLDYVHGRTAGLNSILIMPLLYLRSYKSNVDSKYNKLKYLCNTFFVLACLSLLLNVVFGVLILK
jgi:hypothetical protein